MVTPLERKKMRGKRQGFKELSALRSLEIPSKLGPKITAMFERDIQVPFKALAGVTEAWAATAPEPWRGKVRLESLSHGTLTLAVENEADRYQLDLLLRQGLLARLAVAARPKLVRSVKIRVVPVRTDPRRQPR